VEFSTLGLEPLHHKGLVLEEEASQMKLEVSNDYGERIPLEINPDSDKVIDIKLALVTASCKLPHQLTELDFDLVWGNVVLPDESSLRSSIGPCTRVRRLALRSKTAAPGVQR